MRMNESGAVLLAKGDCLVTTGRGTVCWECMCVSVHERAVLEYSDDGRCACSRLQRHNWRIRGDPPSVEDSTGRVHLLCMEHAYLTMFDGTGLLVTHEGCGPITGVAVIPPDMQLDRAVPEGIDPRRTMAFINRGFGKVPNGTLEYHLADARRTGRW